MALLAVVPFEQFRFWAWDFLVFRAGSKALLNGANPYDPGNVVLFSDGAELASIPYYVYAPFFAILISPLALLPPEIASRIWFVINLGCLLGASLILLREMGWQPTVRGLILLALGIAAFPPTRTLLLIGQSAGVMLLMLAIAIRFLAIGREGLAGVALALALFKPHLLLVPLFLLLRRQWNVVLGTAAAMTVITLPFLGLVDDWAGALISTRTINLAYGCVDFSSLNSLLRCAGLDSGAVLAVLVALSATTIWSIRSPSLPTSRRSLLQLALVVCFSMLAIDNVRVADLSLLIFPGLAAIQWLGQAASGPAKWPVAGALLAAYCFPYLALAYGALSQSPLLYSLPVWYAGTAVSMYLAIGLILAIDQSSGAGLAT